MSLDHIALPQTTLRKFRVAGKSPYHLNIVSGEVKECKIREFNTSEDYYPKPTEKFLSGQVETVLGNLYVYLNKFTSENDSNSLLLNPDIKKKLIRILAVQWLRLPKTHEYIKSQTLFANTKLNPLIFSPLHDSFTEMQLQLDECEKFFCSILKCHEVNICYIEEKMCDSTFVLPTTHFFGLLNQIYLVLSPYHAYVLLPRSENAKYKIDSKNQKYMNLQANQDVDLLCKHICKFESTFGMGKLVGIKEQLEKQKS